MAHQPAEIEALQPEVAADERRRVHGSHQPPANPIADDRPERLQHAEALREDLAADGIEHDVALTFSANSS